MPLTRRHFLFGLAGLSAGGLAGWPPPASAALRSKRFSALGTSIEFRVFHDDRRLAGAVSTEAAHAVFAVHEAMTLFEPSPLRQVNERGYAEPVAVPRVLFDLLVRCRELHGETEGLFDVTVGGVMAWRRALKRGVVTKIPGLFVAASGVGMDNVELDDRTRTVRLRHPATKLDLGGVAKGLAVDSAVAVFRSRGVSNVLVNAGGDIYASGRQDPDSSGWDVDIAAGKNETLQTVTLSDRAVATSGNYQRAFPHLVDPMGGEAAGRVVSASVFALDTVTADAWATAAFVGEPRHVMRLVRARQEVEAILVLSDGFVLASSSEVSIR